MPKPTAAPKRTATVSHAPATPYTTWRWRIAKAGHTAASFAAAIGVNAPQLSRYMRGRVTPLPDTVKRIEKALKGMGV